MIDAYTIGITLALNDGVSSGIAAIRKELTLLDGAVQSAAGAMAGMNALAGVVDWTRFGDIPAMHAARPLPNPAPVAAGKPESLEPAPPVQSFLAAPKLEPPTEVVRPFAVSPAPATATVAVRPAPAVAGMTAPPLPAAARSEGRPPGKTTQAVMAPPSAATTMPSPSQTSAAAPPVPARAVQPEALALLARRILPERTEGTRASPPAGPVATAAQRAAPPAPAATATQPPPPPPGRAAAAKQPVAPPQRPEAVRLAALTLPAKDQPSAPVGSFPPVPSLEIMPIPRQSAPAAPTPATKPPSDVPDNRGELVGPPTLPETAAPQPTQADLYIDGAVLGRWVTRHLERQLVRPPSGIAAVDPRLTPGWAGPATGF